ncbi:hypothetical protein QBC34DRAFT_174501 [Podospora aff. communis PSN243]|uniref:Uncharacterized protein n=1 Tax=Podospora aff. communis PSN243 TaxID=3040156 RepID=A0AAV9H0W0_9PEZI|nr:hypothetical protein QBC34DRAFT_174501 [Podospora aff. communis PSN243]
MHSSHAIAMVLWLPEQMSAPQYSYCCVTRGRLRLRLRLPSRQHQMRFDELVVANLSSVTESGSKHTRVHRGKRCRLGVSRANFKPHTYKHRQPPRRHSDLFQREGLAWLPPLDFPLVRASRLEHQRIHPVAKACPFPVISERTPQSACRFLIRTRETASSPKCSGQGGVRRPMTTNAFILRCYIVRIKALQRAAPAPSQAPICWCQPSRAIELPRFMPPHYPLPLERLLWLDNHEWHIPSETRLRSR